MTRAAHIPERANVYFSPAYPVRMTRSSLDLATSSASRSLEERGNQDGTAHAQSRRMLNPIGQPRAALVVPGSEDAMREGLKNLTFSALRITSGIILAAHGWQKLTDVPSWREQLRALDVAAPEVLAYFAIAGEFLGGLGLIVGLLTPFAAFGTACTSAAAIVLVHWGHGLFASQGGFEFPLTLLMVSLFFVAHGGGAWSLDAGLRRTLRIDPGHQGPLERASPATRGRALEERRT